MITLSLRTWVRNAAAVFSGCYGAVTRQAEQAGCSRQTVYDHARRIEQRLQPAAPARPRPRSPSRRPAAVLDEPTRRRLAVTAFAMGISTRQIEDLFRVILARGRPRSRDHRPLGRRRGQEGQGRPGGARRGLRPPGPDPRGGRDLFWGRPTLVGIEPASMTAVFCHNTADRKAETWEEHLAPFDRLEFAVSDAAKGIAKAVAEVAEARRDDPEAPALEHGLDVFHTAMEAHRVLARHWRRAEAAWERGGGRRRQGRRVETARGRCAGRGPGRPRRLGPGDRVVRAGRAARIGLGSWPTPRWSCSAPTAGSTTAPAPRREIAAALKGLTGPDWAKVRNFLNDPRSLAFLDRMHRRLEAAEPRPEWREAMAWRWWLRHRRPPASRPADGLGPCGGA